MSLVAGSYLGNYHVLEQIGHARMATEYRAQRPGQPGDVSIKVVPAPFAGDGGYESRYQQAMALTTLRHANILSVLDYGEGHQAAYLVTAFLGGSTLAELPGKPFAVDRVRRLLRPVADALDYAHSRGVLHRDVKPTNILLAPDGRPVLADFGLADIIDAARRVSETGEIIGTPAYMSPEQASKEAVSTKTDQYAVAVVAYELLTGRVPFTGSTPRDWLLAHRNQAVPRPRDLNPALSQATEEALRKGLAKRPDDRYATVAAFVDALSGADQGEEALSAPPTAAGVAEVVPIPALAGPPAKPEARAGVLVGATVGGLALAALLTGAVLASRRPPSQASPTPTVVTSAAVSSAVPTSTALLTSSSLAPATTSLAAQANPCQFSSGFQVLAEALSAQVVGACTDNESLNPATGDTVQHTTRGLLTRRKADNTTAFTDGYQSWVIGQDGKPHHRLNTERFPWEANPEGLPMAQ